MLILGQGDLKSRIVGGPVVKNLPAGAGSIPGPRGSHMPWSN